jgi:predicted PhzF superfamily epimerase YddE/YHI9
MVELKRYQCIKIMKIKLFQVDAFTDKLFHGNPAAVCSLDSWLDTNTMQAVAQENNLSETAFFVKEDDTYHIRWFTPMVEVDLCGHATLASSYVIFNFLEPKKDSIEYMSKSGKLFIQKKEDLIILNFPARKPEKILPPITLLSCLSTQPDECWKARDFLLVYPDEKDIINLEIDFEKLKSLDALGLIVTSQSKDYDFISRFFAPAAGINEDPVTGSSFCTLIPYWSERLKKGNLNAYQASKRGGHVSCEMKDDRVIIGGQCRLFLKGEINL